MDIREGLKIFIDRRVMGNRIELSAGAHRVDILNGVVCKSPTYTATGPWRAPSVREAAVLMAGKQDTGDFQTVGLLRLPETLEIRFRKLGLENGTSYREIHAICSGEAYRALLQDTIRYYEKFAIVKNSSVPHNVYLGDANLVNNTFNQKEKTFIGLHLDSFERDSPTREAARNRICINLGKEYRYLQFVNLSFDQLADLCDMARTTRNGNPYDILCTFFDRFGTYPVTRIRIDPYEAYIAPTENIIHDGSTEGTSHPDVNVAIRGFFRVPVQRGLFANLFK